MCGRYTLWTEKVDWSTFGINWPFADDLDWTPSYNIAPTTWAPVVPNLTQPEIALYRWGLVPFWAKDPSMGHRMINARSETVREKPAFREAFKKRRCLVLADGFYEWRKEGKNKSPYYICTKSPGLMTFAGLWETNRAVESQELRTFTILTTTPNSLIAPIHNRMPVILSSSVRERWLDPSTSDTDSLSYLLRPCPEDELQVQPVSRLVNSPTNNSPDCIRSV